MRIGPDRDPLLATWQTGLGRVSAWTSDASLTWSQQWADWDGYVQFWGRLVKSTFQAGDTAGAAQAQVSNGVLTVSVEGGSNFPDGSEGVAIVAGPDGQRFEVPLDRVGGNRFEAAVPATRPGTYAVGVSVTDDSEVVLTSSTLASESYPREYAPGTADLALMSLLSTTSGGRGEIDPAAAWDARGLDPGVRRIALAGPFLVLAALLWPLAVALSRLSLRGATWSGARAGVASARRRVRSSLPRLGVPDPDNAPAPSRTAPGASARTPSRATDPPPTGRTATMSELLARKREREQAAGQRHDDD
jgi:hypothetical protein